MTGTHKLIDLNVVDESERSTRLFTLRPRGSGVSIQFRTPVDRIEPILWVEIKDQSGNVVYRLTVDKSNVSGTVTSWTEVKLRDNGKGLGKVKFELIEGRINQPLPLETFSTDRPDDWAWADYRPEKLVVLNHHGKPETHVAGQEESKAGNAARSWGRALVSTFFFIAMCYFGVAMWRRRQSIANSRS